CLAHRGGAARRLADRAVGRLSGRYRRDRALCRDGADPGRLCRLHEQLRSTAARGGMSTAPASDYSARELLIATIADLLEGVRHVAVGASSPIPAAAAMLLRARNEIGGRERLRISILGSRQHNFF